MSSGDHLRVRRHGLYWHHGIDLGNGYVIHASGEPGRMKLDAEVRYSSWDDFARGGEVETVDDGSQAEGDEIVDRALTALGNKDYSLLFNNCEHFARWCRTGTGSSAQVDYVAVASAVVGIGTRLALSGLANRAGASLALRALPLAGPVATGLAIAGTAVAVGSRLLRSDD